MAVRREVLFRQRTWGVAIKDGDLRFLWRDGHLVRVNGRPRAQSEVTGLVPLFINVGDTVKARENGAPVTFGTARRGT